MTRKTIPVLIAAALAGTAASALAQSAGDVTALGRSAQSGAVCQAVRDYDDPVAQTQGGRAWSIQCLGWDAPIGRLYSTPNPAALAAWRQGLAKRASCAADTPAALGGVADVRRQACKLTAGDTPYLVYEGKRGGRVLAGEGFAAAEDMLETGLRVTSGAMPAPRAAQAGVSAASAETAALFGGATTGLASSLKAAATDPERLRDRGYVQNNEWRFDGAETDFRSLVAATQARNAPPRERAEALLNLALNVSDSGRFQEADGLFDQADPFLAQANDPVLSAEALNYRALHLRNQGKFAEAVAMAQSALERRQSARQTLENRSTLAAGSGPVVIGPTLSEALNVRSGGQDLLGGQAVSPLQRLQIQDVETYEIIGSSKAAAGDEAGARAALDQASQTLARAEAGGVLNVQLHARVEADFGDLAMAQKQPAEALGRYEAALKIIRIRHAGTSLEAGMLLDVGRAQIAAGQADAAIASYDQAVTLFRNARGSLGDSADALEPYFDLLIERTKSDPGRAKVYADHFFTAAQTVVSSATAATAERLEARVASGDDATAGLVRAVDDLRREQTIAESKIAELQAADAYKGDAKTQADANLKTVQGELQDVSGQLLTVNPRYDQLVSSEASLDQLQKALRPGEAYFKTVLLSDRGYGLLVTAEAATPFPIPLSRSQAANAATRIRAPFEARNLPPFDVAASYALFEALAGPVKAELLAARHLVYDPDAVLVSVPAALLVTDPASVELMKTRTGAARNDYTGVSWLSTRMDSSLVTSAASFLQSRAFAPSRASRAYLGFGDPAFSAQNPAAFQSVLTRGAESGEAAATCSETRQALLALRPLPETANELQTIAGAVGAPSSDVVLGDRFTSAAVRERGDLNDYRILYFATHAILPMPQACLPEPALVTSTTGPGGGGLLDASDILNLKLDADLVVLSACDTGGAGSEDAARTGLQGGGEALGGLARAMIYAGARALVVSHWAVSSSATVQLMTDLFRSGAPSQAEALQQAQERMQKEAQFSHPYYWAPFTLVGDGARPIAAGKLAQGQGKAGSSPPS